MVKGVGRDSLQGQTVAVTYIRNIPEDVKAQFKAWCARRGKTMTQRIIELMREDISEDLKDEVRGRSDRA